MDDAPPCDCLGVAIDAGVGTSGSPTGGGIFVLKRLFKKVCLSNSSGLLIGFPLGCQPSSEAHDGPTGRENDGSLAGSPGRMICGPDRVLADADIDWVEGVKLGGEAEGRWTLQGVT